MSDDRPFDPDDPQSMAELMGRMMSGRLSPDDLTRLQAELSATLGMQLPPELLRQAMAQVNQVMNAPESGPVNWQLATDAARRSAVFDDEGRKDESVGDAARRATLDGLRTASMWLDPVCALPAPAGTEHAWSRAEWVEATSQTWHSLTEPVAAHVATALTATLTDQLPPEMQQMAAQAGAMLRKMGGAVFGAQVGQAIGALSSEVVGAHDIGLPLVGSGTAALLPANVTAFGEGLGVPAQEVLLYLALRETAYARLFAHAGWLRARVLAAVEEYARGITIDTSALQEAVRSVDPTDLAALQQAMSSGMFEPKRTPAQQAVLTRLETTLALIDGWVDEVAHAAAVSVLPEAARLREAVRRRRAAGGPAEHTLATLVGLELRPRRLRDACALWAAVTQQHGFQARDEVWDHPDLMPDGADLDDPVGYAQRFGRPQLTELDEELRKLLDGDG